jgi:hypothetical protein
VRGAVNSSVACLVPQPRLSNEINARLIVIQQARNRRFGNPERSDSPKRLAFRRVEPAF